MAPDGTLIGTYEASRGLFATAVLLVSVEDEQN